MKSNTHSEYDPQQVGLAESALLTLWPVLEPWHNDLVLVGGLVPRYICREEFSRRALPRPVTIDADIGIALAAAPEGMSSLQFALFEAGFGKTTSPEGLVRYARQVGVYSIPIDFLTDAPPYTHGSVQVDDITANILPGINRALATARNIAVRGENLHGVIQQVNLRVSDAGPFLAMKLRAFAHRQAPKDAFDLLYLLYHYDRGTSAAVAALVEEMRAGNPAGKDALACLNMHFRDEQSLAPVKAGVFVCGQKMPKEAEDIQFQRRQIQQQVVEAGRMLRAAIAGLA